MAKHSPLSAFFTFLIIVVVAADLRLDGGENGWDTDQWWVQVDGVMGGRSSGFLEYEQDDTVMRFSGDINVVGGGFSSVRKWLDASLDLSSYAGIVIELEAQSYDPLAVKAPLGLHFELNDEPSRYSYSAAFAVPLAMTEGQNTSIFLPLTSFDRASRFGFVCTSSNCVLDPTRVDELDFSVLFQEGPFDIKIKGITAVTNATSFLSPVLSMTTSDQTKALIDATISSGAKVYDYGYSEICIAIYRSTLNSILAATGTPDTIKDLACQGLERAAGLEASDKVNVAWTLRGALDDILDDIEAGGPVVSRTSGSGNMVVSTPQTPRMILLFTLLTTFWMGVT